MSTVYHESGLSPGTSEIHRALASLIEELEAIDWYTQRIDVTGDAELQSILTHNRNEEIEHAAMTLEWLRRKLPPFDEELRTYLFTSGSITEAEKSADSGD
jgi:ferritin-like protein